MASSVMPRTGLLSVDEAAQYLAISKGTLYNWLSMKKIEYVKVGRRTAFRQAALDRFISENTVPARESE